MEIPDTANPSTRPCPTAELLVAFGHARLPDLDFERVAGHLSQCTACEKSLETLFEVDDDLSLALRQSPSDEPFDAVLLEEVIARLNEMTTDVTAIHPVRSSRPSFEIGTVIGHYELLSTLGSGGMGHVYKALHRHLKRTVAIKVLSPQLSASPAVIRRFRQEAEAAGRLSHPSVVATSDAGEYQGMPYLVMEYIAGTDLSSLVRMQGPLSPPRAIEFATQIARGLEYVHSKGLVHRDVKPSNVMLDGSGVVKILDLGLAQFKPGAGCAVEGELLTTTGNVLGTIDFMAPEQALDARSVDHRVDVYGLGCTLFFLLTGRRMYEGDTVLRRILAHREAPIPSLSAIRPELPTALDETIRKMVAKRPEDRYPSMAAVRTALEAALPAAARSERAASASSKSWRRAAVIGAALMAVLAAVGAAILSRQHEPFDALPDAKRSALTVEPRAPSSPRAERLAAEWALAEGAQVTVQLAAKRRKSVSVAEDLPQEAFEVVDIDFWREARFHPNVTDNDLAVLTPLAGLRHLALDGTGVTDKGLSDLRGLTSLTRLGLSRTAVDDAGLVHLEPLRRLQSLSFDTTRVGSAGLAHLREMSQLQVLHLGGSPAIGDEGMRHVAELVGLRDLSLGSLPITDDGLAALAPLVNLKSLILTATRITDRGLRTVAGFERLNTLILAATQITDEGLENLVALKQLRRLNVQSTSVSLGAVQKLQRELPSCQIEYDAAR